MTMARNGLACQIELAQQYATLDLLREIVIQKPAEGSEVCTAAEELL